MSVQILGGFARQYNLKVFPHPNLRPTSVRLRRKVFDAHQDLSGWIFCDLCAGTGAMGLEALSRGADSVLFIEKVRSHFDFLKKELTRFQQHFTSQHFVDANSIKSIMGDFCFPFKDSLFVWGKDTILFFDPPYADHQGYHDILKYYNELNKKLMLKDNSSAVRIQLWLESDSQKGISLKKLEEVLADFPELKMNKIYGQGTQYIAIINYNILNSGD